MDPNRLESTNSVEAYLSTFGPRQYSHTDLKKFTSNFSQLIGGGAYGKVYRGISGNLEVAVKVLEKTDIAEETFLSEIQTMQASHRNLIKLYGYCFQPIGLKALVYEYMKNGSFDKILYEDANNLKWENLYDIAIEVAKGLVYLHDGWHETIIHYDVKASNILLDINHSPKISDFGTAKLVKRDVDRVDLTRIRGTDGYNAPETWIPGSIVTNKCDVFSFGMMLFEVLGRRKNGNGENWFPGMVWKKFMSKQMVDIFEDSGIVSKQDKEKAKLLSMVAFWCTQFGADERPSMAEVVHMLEKRLPVGNPPPPFPNWRPSASIITSELMVIPEIFSDDDESLDISSTTVDARHDASINASKEEHKKDERAEDSDSTSSESIEEDSDSTSSESIVEDSDEEATSNFSNEVSKDLDNTSLESIDLLQHFDQLELSKLISGFSRGFIRNGFERLTRGKLPNGVQIDVVKYNSDDFGTNIMETLPRTAHPNIIKLYGHVFDKGERAFVYEHVGDTTLANIFLDYMSYEWVKLYDVAVQIAKGMAYLHNCGNGYIVHNNISPSSIFLDQYFSPKIACFNRAKFIAPEGSLSHLLSWKSDVFSYGVILFDILMMKSYTIKHYAPRYLWNKFRDGNLDKAIEAIHHIPEKNRTLAKILCMVGFWCLQYEPEARPSMREVLTMLERKQPVEAPPNLFLESFYSS